MKPGIHLLIFFLRCNNRVFTVHFSDMHVNSSSGIIGNEYLDCASTVDTIDTFLSSFF